MLVILLAIFIIYINSDYVFLVSGEDEGRMGAVSLFTALSKTTAKLNHFHWHWEAYNIWLCNIWSV